MIWLVKRAKGKRASVVLCHAKVYRASPPHRYGLVRSEREKANRRFRREFYLMTPEQPTTPPMQNPEKNPADWTTGDEPMTGPQRSYLQTLCREAGEEFNPDMTKADASRKIDELQEKTGRGKK
jgi:hypothetical protein